MVREKRGGEDERDGSVDRSIDGTKKHLLYLDSLDSILDLEQPALGAEGVDAPIVLGAGEEHCLSREGDKEKELRERKERGSFSFFFLHSSSRKREVKRKEKKQQQRVQARFTIHFLLSASKPSKGASSSSKFRASALRAQTRSLMPQKGLERS